MKRAYVVNHKLYILLVLIFAVTLVIAFVLSTCSNGSSSILAQVLLNLSYGCIASTVVAWLIECASTKNNNIKARELYDAVYLDLKLDIGFYLDLWSQFCAVSFKDVDYYNEKYTWSMWYKLTNENYHKAEPDKQAELRNFYSRELSNASKKIVESIDRILSQRYYLTMNNVIDSDLHSIIIDFRFEFSALVYDMSHNQNDELFWRHLDAISQDLINYINNWPDIKFYNTESYAPFKFYKLLEIHSKER